MSIFNQTSIVLLMFFVSLVTPKNLLAVSKNEISLFKYNGVIQQHNSAVIFDSFQGLLRLKLKNIRREILNEFPDQSTSNQKLVYLNDKFIKYRNSDTFLTDADVKQWMVQQSNILGVLRGSLILDSNQSYALSTEFYPVYDSSYRYNTIVIKLPYESTEFGTSQDSHSVVFLYVLALDAIALDLESSYIINFLGLASNKLADIKRRNQGTLPGDLKQIEDAIESIIMKLRKESRDND